MKALLGRCTSSRWCWRRSMSVATLTPRDANGDVCGASRDYELCEKHADEWMRALISVADEIELEVDVPMRVRLPTAHDDEIRCADCGALVGHMHMSRCPRFAPDTYVNDAYTDFTGSED